MTVFDAKCAQTVLFVWAFSFGAFGAIVDFHEDFAEQPGGVLQVVDDDGDMECLLAGGSRVEPDGDVIIDARIGFTVVESLEVPTLPADAKFSLWLYGGATTNFYVTAGGETSVGVRYNPTNYRLIVPGATIDGGNWHRVTVRAIKGIGLGMMGFVVFIDGQMAVCDDENYADKLPHLERLSPIAEYLVSKKALFPSMASYKLIEAQNLASVGFRGTGRVDSLSVVEAIHNTPDFAVIETIFILRWGEGILGFTLKVGESGADLPVDAAVCGENRRLFVAVGDAAKVCVTNIVYDEESGYHGAAGYEFNSAEAQGSMGVERCNFEVGGTAYTTIAQAYGAVADGGEIRLLRDVDETVQEVLVVRKPFTIDLVGHTLRIDGNDKPLFMVYSADMSLVSSQSGGELQVVGGARAAFEFLPKEMGLPVPSATIGAKGGENGVSITGRLVSGGTQNLVIVSGRFTDDAVKGYVADGGICSGKTDADGFYLVPESGAVRQNLSVALTGLSLAMVAAGEEASIEVAAMPGFYYGVATGTSPDALSVQDWVLATSDKVVLPVPRPPQNHKAAFFRIEAASEPSS